VEQKFCRPGLQEPGEGGRNHSNNNLSLGTNRGKTLKRELGGGGKFDRRGGLKEHPVLIHVQRVRPVNGWLDKGGPRGTDERVDRVLENAEHTN